MRSRVGAEELVLSVKAAASRSRTGADGRNDAVAAGAADIAGNIVGATPQVPGRFPSIFPLFPLDLEALNYF